MKNTLLKSTLALSLLASSSIALPEVTFASAGGVVQETASEKKLQLSLQSRFTSGAAFDEGGTEIVQYDPKSQNMYSINGDEGSLDVIHLGGVGQSKEVELTKRIKLSDYGIESSDVTSVAIHPNGDYIAVAAPHETKTNDGYLVLMTTDGEYIKHFSVGPLPDMVTFSPDGKHILVANEGEPNDDYTINPEGSISIVKANKSANKITQKDITTPQFTKDLMTDDIRGVGPDADEHYLNLEPEYITVDSKGKYAYVTLQESNAIAKVKIASNTIEEITSLGFKDYSKAGNEIDASDKDDETTLKKQPVLSMYMPDAIASFDMNGETYLFTANEGDAQDYDGYSEEERVKDIKDDIKLDASHYEGYTQDELDQLIEDGLFKKSNLGRLKTTTSHPFINEHGEHEAIVGYGGRSFSVWNGNTMEQVFDSGNDFERITLEQIPEYFNSNAESATEFELDARSDDKGPEPESIEFGVVDGVPYVFIGLERTGGIMVYNLTNPEQPEFETYFRDDSNTDVSPEGLTFVSAEESPTGSAMLLAAHELSGTVAVYNLERTDVE